jgi:hypothetical protein
VRSRNGSGVNLDCFRSDRPRLGEPWHAEIDAAPFPGLRETIVLVSDRALSGTPSPFGELLIATDRAFFQSTMQALDGVHRHTLTIPASPGLVGRRAHAQAVLIGERVQLSNALDLVLGY